mgnify:CR=1 FL=1
MLITELKDKEVLSSQISGKVFVINCHGCKEVYFPEAAAEEFEKELDTTGIITTDYICNPENLSVRLAKHAAAIEAADVVLMDDQPSKIALAMRIARRTIGIAKQNIVFAIGVKVAVLVLATMGLGNMWLAVMADVGVTVLAVLNAMRALRVRA